MCGCYVWLLGRWQLCVAVMCICRRYVCDSVLLNWYLIGA